MELKEAGERDATINHKKIWWKKNYISGRRNNFSSFYIIGRVLEIKVCAQFHTNLTWYSEVANTGKATKSNLPILFYTQMYMYILNTILYNFDIYLYSG